MPFRVRWINLVSFVAEHIGMDYVRRVSSDGDDDDVDGYDDCDG